MFIGLAISALVGYFMYSSNAGQKSDEVKIIIPKDYDDLFKKYGSIYGVDWKLLKRISWIESNLGLNPKVANGIKNPKDIIGSVSYDGLSWGLMQMTLTTARDYDKTATSERLNNPAYAIELATRHIKRLKTLFSNERDIVMSYNQGQGNQKKFINAEVSGTLLTNQYLQAREYWKKFNLAKGVIV